MSRLLAKAVLAAVGLAGTAASAAVNTTTCNGATYAYEELAGYGYISTNAKDKYGDTIGGIGSSIWLDQTAWTRTRDGKYEGLIWTLPDRGWNTEGTLNFVARVHKFGIKFTPQPNATVDKPSGPNLVFTYNDTILLTGPDGNPTTGLDADGSGHLSYAGFPDMPVSTFSGDGFGGTDGGNQTSRRIPIDSEGLWVNSDGSFWVSDEYGPYVYHFDANGKMTAAIRPPDAIIPMRNGTESWSANSPAYYDNEGAGDDISPADNPTGRDNNHGFEGLTVTDDGKTLWVLLQAAANQEGGLGKQTERYARLVKYDVSGRASAQHVAEYVVPLPLYHDPTAKASKNPKVAAQSEIHGLPNGQFFVLSRDSGSGHGQDESESVYRHIDVFDIQNATDIQKAGGFDCATCAIADSDGVLNSTITPATYCPFLDFNVNAQLNRFGVHNGGDQDAHLLNEKWESISLVPADPDSGNEGNEYYVFSLSDNDFITQNGTLNFGRFSYQDSSGYALDSQALVFRVRLPL